MTTHKGKTLEINPGLSLPSYLGFVLLLAEIKQPVRRTFCLIPIQLHGRYFLP